MNFLKIFRDVVREVANRQTLPKNVATAAAERRRPLHINSLQHATWTGS